jgi:hypothetical protein
MLRRQAGRTSLIGDLAHLRHGAAQLTFARIPRHRCRVRLGPPAAAGAVARRRARGGDDRDRPRKGPVWKLAALVDPELTTLTAFAVAQRYPAPSHDPMALDEMVDRPDAVSATNIAGRSVGGVRARLGLVPDADPAGDAID